VIAARGAAVARAYRNVLALSVRIKETEVGLDRDEVDGDAARPVPIGLIWLISTR
jgi:hypothetical protein